jgi:hypothetical protein
MRAFDSEVAPAYLNVLRELTEAPNSQFATELAKEVRDWLKLNVAPTPADIWNFYKWLLDMCVYCAGGSSFVLRLLDLEPFYLKPEGAFKTFPWRSDMKKTWRTNYT